MKVKEPTQNKSNSPCSSPEYPIPTSPDSTKIKLSTKRKLEHPNHLDPKKKRKEMGNDKKEPDKSAEINAFKLEINTYMGKVLKDSLKESLDEYQKQVREELANVTKPITERQDEADSRVKALEDRVEEQGKLLNKIQETQTSHITNQDTINERLVQFQAEQLEQTESTTQTPPQPNKEVSYSRMSRGKLV